MFFDPDRPAPFVDRARRLGVADVEYLIFRILNYQTPMTVARLPGWSLTEVPPGPHPYTREDVEVALAGCLEKGWFRVLTADEIRRPPPEYSAFDLHNRHHLGVVDYTPIGFALSVVIFGPGWHGPAHLRALVRSPGRTTAGLDRQPQLEWWPGASGGGGAAGMEIIGIGTEIVECPRIGRMVEHHGELFLRRVYTGREIRFCQGRKHAIEHFAGLWAAKEAIFKALGTYGSRQVAWTDIEVSINAIGRPQVRVGGSAKVVARRVGVADILVSISHCRTYATAYAMAVAGPKATPPLPQPDEPVDPVA